MKTFQTLQELLDYIPNCIICGKPMELRIVGSIPLKGEPSWRNTRSICFKMFVLEDKLHSRKHKDFSLVIDPTTNHISSGKDVLNQMVWTSYSGIIALKKCKTCNFKIEAEYTNGINSQKLHVFPELRLVSEEIHYTMRRHKLVQIYKRYHRPDSGLGDGISVVVGHFQVNLSVLDFAKIQDLDHLNNKIKTFLVFQ